MRTRLIYHPLPQLTEGLHGYLLRLAEGNGYNGVSFLCGGQPITLPRLQQWLGLETIQPLQHLKSQLDYPRHAFIQPWNYKTSRYCPECLQEAPIWRAEWECTYFTTCPTHGCQLIGTCGACEKPLTWRRRKLLACDCGAPLETGRRDASKAEIRLANALLSKIYYGLRPERLLLTLNLTQLCQLIHVLGAYANTDVGKNHQKLANVVDIRVVQKLTKAAADILDDWPTSFYLMLENLKNLHTDPNGKVSISKNYGNFYSHVFSSMKESEFRFIREALETHVVGSWLQPLTQRNKRISPEKRGHGSWLPLKAAAEQLGTSSHQLELLFEAGLMSLNIGRSASGRKTRYVERSMLPAIQRLVDDLVDQQTACTILNLGKSRMLQLLKYQVIDTLIVPQKRGAKWGVSRKPLQKFLGLGGGLPHLEADSVGTVRLDFALQYWLHQEFLFPSLIRAVSNREIFPVGISHELEGIQSWVFDHEQLKQWCDDQIRQARDGAMTIPQVAVDLRLKQEVVYHLAKEGLLKISDIQGRGGTALITREELHSFNNHYALSRELADLVGTSPSQATRMLDRYGMKPICGRKIDGCRQNVYLRGPQLIEALQTFEQVH